MAVFSQREAQSSDDLAGSPALGRLPAGSLGSGLCQNWELVPPSVAVLSWQPLGPTLKHSAQLVALQIKGREPCCEALLFSLSLCGLNTSLCSWALSASCFAKGGFQGSQSKEVKSGSEAQDPSIFLTFAEQGDKRGKVRKHKQAKTRNESKHDAILKSINIDGLDWGESHSD